MPARRLFLLEYGAELCPKSWSVLGADDELRWVPVVGVAVETDIGWVVLETGFSRQAVDDREACAAVYGEGHDPRAKSGEPFAHALEDVGLKVADIALAAVSHFHIDHTGGLPLLAEAGVPVVVQRKELDFARHAGLEVAYYRPDFADRDIEWRVLEGDGEIAPAYRRFSRRAIRRATCPIASSCPRRGRGSSPSTSPTSARTCSTARRSAPRRIRRTSREPPSRSSESGVSPIAPARGSCPGTTRGSGVPSAIRRGATGSGNVLRLALRPATSGTH
jgi:hypothetical protein